MHLHDPAHPVVDLPDPPRAAHHGLFGVHRHHDVADGFGLPCSGGALALHAADRRGESLRRDPHALPGGSLKAFRHVRNLFFRNYIAPPPTVRPSLRRDSASGAVWPVTSIRIGLRRRPRARWPVERPHTTEHRRHPGRPRDQRRKIVDRDPIREQPPSRHQVPPRAEVRIPRTGVQPPHLAFHVTMSTRKEGGLAAAEGPWARREDP